MNRTRPFQVFPAGERCAARTSTTTLDSDGCWVGSSAVAGSATIASWAGFPTIDRSAAPDELAGRAVDFDDAAVAQHDHRRRHGVDRRLPAELGRVADQRRRRRARPVARERLLPADPPGGQHPQGEREGERGKLALRPQGTDREHADPRRDIERPDTRPSAVAERGEQDRPCGCVGTRAAKEEGRLRHDGQQRRPQQQVGDGRREIGMPGRRRGVHGVLRVDVDGRDQEAGGPVDGVRGRASRSPGRRRPPPSPKRRSGPRAAAAPAAAGAPPRTGSGDRTVQPGVGGVAHGALGQMLRSTALVAFFWVRLPRAAGRRRTAGPFCVSRHRSRRPKCGAITGRRGMGG